MEPDKLLDAGPSERGWHQFEQANRCMRWWAFNHKADMNFPLTMPLVRGSLFHVGLAHYYLHRQNNNHAPGYLHQLDAVKRLGMTEWAETTGAEAQLWKDQIEPVQRVIKDYTMRYDSSCDWKILEVERELRAHIPNLNGEGTFLYTQRADLIIEDVGGGVWIVDHKTCSRIDSKSLRQHILNGQFLGYQCLGRVAYPGRFRGVIINRVKMSEPYGYHRCPIEPAPSALSHFIHSLKQTEERIQKYAHLEKPLDYPPVFSEQICYGKYGPCPAFETCQWGESQ
tara:strand:+ start:4897 stop:5745 length:849 start_codon:yes stop_codon:yes gene_type:complete